VLRLFPKTASAVPMSLNWNLAKETLTDAECGVLNAKSVALLRRKDKGGLKNSNQTYRKEALAGKEYQS